MISLPELMCFHLCLWVYAYVSVAFFFLFFCFQEATIPSAESLLLLDFDFSDFGLPEDLTTQATIRMFLDLSLVQDFNMDYKVTERLLLILLVY